LITKGLGSKSILTKGLGGKGFVGVIVREFLKLKSFILTTLSLNSKL